MSQVASTHEMPVAMKKVDDMRKSLRPTPLPGTPALVRRTASIAVVAAAVSAVGCTHTVPPQTPEERDGQQALPPQAPPPQAPPPQVEEPQIAAPQVASPPPQIPQRPTPVKDD